MADRAVASHSPGAGMPDDDDVGVGTIDRALAGAAPVLDSTGRRVAVATYRTLARGRPAAPAAIAEAAGVARATVEDLLHEWGAVFRDDSGAVVGFWGLAVVEMPHRVRAGGHDLFAWCAWDPLFLAHLIGPLSVATDDPETGEQLTYRLDGQGGFDALSHPDSVLSFLRPDAEWDDSVLATFCHHVRHFASPASAARWTTRHARTFVLDLAGALELARRHVLRTFGDAL